MQPPPRAATAASGRNERGGQRDEEKQEETTERGRGEKHDEGKVSEWQREVRKSFFNNHVGENQKDFNKNSHC